jgi:hypothetical protein
MSLSSPDPLGHARTIHRTTLACRRILGDGGIEDESSLLNVEGHLVEEFLKAVEDLLAAQETGEDHPCREPVEIQALTIDAIGLDTPF